MKPTSLFALAAALLAPLSLSAQASSATVGAAANVTAVVTVGTITDLNFGNITAGGGAVSVAASASNASPKAAGVVPLNFNTSSVTASFPSALTLTGPNSETLSATLVCNGYAQANAGGTATACTGTTTLSTTFNYNGSSTALSQGWLYIGGSLTPTAGQRAGAYTGTITITLTNSTT